MMKVVFSVVGQVQQLPNKTVDMQTIPRLGELVSYPVGDETVELTVRTVVWSPFPPDPHVYVVIGNERPGWAHHIA